MQLFVMNLFASTLVLRSCEFKELHEKDFIKELFVMKSENVPEGLNIKITGKRKNHTKAGPSGSNVEHT